MKLNYRNSKNADAVARFWGKSLSNPDWYSIKEQNKDNTEIFIYDVIGWPFIDANIFVQELSKIDTKNITLRINSPGGDVFDGMAIHNALKAHESNVITKIEGIAASMGSVVALAGDEVQAYDNTMLMIHDPWSIAIGNQYDFKEISDILSQLSENILSVYYKKSKVGKRALKQMMKDETWMKPDVAKEKGFIDTIIDGSENDVEAKFDLSMFAHTPEDIICAKEGKELTVREIERALRDAGASLNSAKRIAAGCSNKDYQRDVGNLISELENITSIFKKE